MNFQPQAFRALTKCEDIGFREGDHDDGFFLVMWIGECRLRRGSCFMVGTISLREESGLHLVPVC